MVTTNSTVIAIARCGRGRVVSDGKTFERHPWSTPLRDCASYKGGRAARRGEATWRLPSGDFTYGEFVLESLRTDPGAGTARDG